MIDVKNAASIIKKSRSCIAFTGAGISVESGIPPFRGNNSIWEKYDPLLLELSYFKKHPDKSWPAIKEIFYDCFDKALPNKAHYALANLEGAGILKCIITQNIDNLHQQAGSREVYEFHGNSRRLVCLGCGMTKDAALIDFSTTPVTCNHCDGLLKPDFIFFGENIPHDIYLKSINAARNSDVCIIVGSTGEVMPAAMIPEEAKRFGATIIEINPEISNFSQNLSDIHLRGKASEVFEILDSLL